MKFTDHIIPSTTKFSHPKWMNGRTSKWHDNKQHNGICINPYYFYHWYKLSKAENTLFSSLSYWLFFSIPVQKPENLGSLPTPLVYKWSRVILNTCVMLVQRATPYPKMSWGFSALALNKTESLTDLFSPAYSVSSLFFSASNKGSTPENYPNVY